MFSRLFVPDTVNYMIAGYLVVAVMIFGYILSLILRWRKAFQEVKVFSKEQE
ncbi:MAG: hypothetical protein MUO54_16290 [Anaerolineales bacterium]|nr:hypothetical protein [Anaerolineales bacterium]